MITSKSSNRKSDTNGKCSSLPVALTADSKLVRKRVSSLKPSPENLRLYNPVHEDPDGPKLDKDMEENGQKEPLVVTGDNYIISGHRRYGSMIRRGVKWAWCMVKPFRRVDVPTDQYIELLRSYKLQRPKTAAEQGREELVDLDPDDCFDRLWDQEDKSVNAPEHNGVQILTIEGSKRRHNISEDKAEHVKYIKKIVFEERRAYWPLSVRGVHYPLLNYNFIRGVLWPHRGKPGYGTKIELPYRNDDNSYHATSNLITRLRLLGEIPWEAFDDFTRPLEEFHPFDNVKEFIRQENEKLYDGYWRNYLQSQPNYIEVVCEKNTIYHMVLQVTKKYQIWTSSGRGFNSIDPWHDLYERYRASDKKRLIVIVLSDYDPEGEWIPHVGGRTLRDDFGVDEQDLAIIKLGVRRDQVDKYNLPPMNFAKEGSKLRQWFVHRNGGDDTVWELEAVEPENMLGDLDEDIRKVIGVRRHGHRQVAKPYRRCAGGAGRRQHR
jgi:hypothetical protein